MITESQDYSHPIVCSICRQQIKDRATFCQIGVNYGITCVQCYRKFSAENLELIANLFMAFGGYFGQFKRSEFSVLRILKAIHEDLLPIYEEKGIEELNIRMLHRALLHGISPQEYIDNIEQIFEE